MSALADLDPQTRSLVERVAIEEIHLFGAAGDPAAIERLAESGRAGCEEAGPGPWVSDAMEAMAAELRQRQREMAAAAGALGSVVRLMIGR